MQRSDHPLLSVAEALTDRADGLHGRGTVECERLRVEHRGFFAGHALPRAVVHVVEAMQNADVRHSRLVGDDLRGGDCPAQRAGIHGGEPFAGQAVRRVNRVLVTAGVERYVPAAAIAVLYVQRGCSVAHQVEPAPACHRLRQCPGFGHDLVCHSCPSVTPVRVAMTTNRR